MSKFIDNIILHVSGGKGGPGSVHFHREKYVPRGGPDGGDGGLGGSVYIKVNPQAYNLDHLNSWKSYKAGDGEPGTGQKKFGKKGKDLEIVVPPGVVITDMDTEEIIFDANREYFQETSSPLLICNGGKGGQGNVHFATSTNQTPLYAQKGLPGDERNIRIDLKLIADIGFVGLPNAGKSTLLSKLTNATPKIADYPFTTLIPQLGTILIEGPKGPVVVKLADIPGIIKGAHQGSGLGLSFLQHIERVFIIFYILEVSEKNPVYTLKILKDELASYNENLLKKPSFIIFNKMDLLDPDEKEEIQSLYFEEFSKNFNISSQEIFFISAKDGDGLEKIRNLILDRYPILNETKI
jgi:GTP-binding protein